MIWISKIATVERQQLFHLCYLVVEYIMSSTVSIIDTPSALKKEYRPTAFTSMTRAKEIKSNVLINATSTIAENDISYASCIDTYNSKNRHNLRAAKLLAKKPQCLQAHHDCRNILVSHLYLLFIELLNL